MTVVGRDRELAAIAAFLADDAEGAKALVLSGEAGAGKTTVWNAALRDAEVSGALVLRAHPAASEIALSFSGIGDLLAPVLDRALEPLPEPQRHALQRALLLEPDDVGAADPHGVGLAVLNVLRTLGGEQPTVVAVDDAHWLDGASAAALAYASRRLGAEPVRVLATRRTELESALVDELRSLPDGLVEVEVGPLDPSCLHRVVQDRLDVALPRPLLLEVHAAAAGNPFYALEIVRTLKRSGAAVEAGHPLPVPESLHDLVHERLRGLPAESRLFLAAAAAHAHPTVAVTESASTVGREAGLRPALEAQVVELAGDRILFTHPLLAAGAYELADPLARAGMHARLADLLESPEARAWQLAAATTEPAEPVAEELDRAAHGVRARGAPRPAALLLDRARELTPPSHAERARRRAVDAAWFHFEAGDSTRAEDGLRTLVRDLGPGDGRARALERLARVRSYDDLRQGAELFRAAIDEADADREVCARAHEGVATCLLAMRSGLTSAVEHAVLAASLGDEALAARATWSQVLLETILGRSAAGDTLERGLALHVATGAGPPPWTAAAHWLLTDEHARARDACNEALAHAREHGDESSLPALLARAGLVDCLLGNYSVAVEYTREGRELSEQAGRPLSAGDNLAVESLAEAERGSADGARAAAEAAIELGRRTGASDLTARWALGRLALSVADPEEASNALDPCVSVARAEGLGEPGAMGFVPDRVEALVELGHLEEAGELLDWFESRALRLARVSALATSRRCRGLVLAAEGDVEGAIGTYAAALEHHARVELPIERARTLLALGAAQRRLNRRRLARATLDDALDAFERIGAARWAERARAEIGRISGRAASPSALTPAEARVATLVAEGKTNREVAATLFLSDRTVEGHLTHVFGKLGIRNRGEVGPALAARQEPGDTASNTGDVPVSADPTAS